MGGPHGSVMTGHRTLLSWEICYAAFEAAKFEQGDTPFMKTIGLTLLAAGLLCFTASPQEKSATKKKSADAGMDCARN